MSVIMAYNDIAKDGHSYNATREERSLVETRIKRRWCTRTTGSERWLQSGVGDMQQDVQGACRNNAETHQFIPQQQVRQRSNQQFEGHEEDVSTWIWVEVLCSRDNDFFPFLCVILVARVRQLVGRRGTGQLHHGVNRFFLVPDETFRLPEIQSLGNRRGGVISTPTAHTFFSCAICQRSQHCVLPKSVHVTPRHAIHHILDERHTITVKRLTSISSFFL